MAVIRTVATMLVLCFHDVVCLDEAVCKNTRAATDQVVAADCSISMLQVDTKRQEQSFSMSQQQRAEVHSAMADLHAALLAHPKVAKQALHEVLLDMGSSSHGKVDKNGHSIVAARQIRQAPFGQASEQLPTQALLLNAFKQPAPPTEGPAPPTGGPAASEAPAAKGVQIAPFGKEDTASELTEHAERTQDTLVDAVENAEVAEVKRAVFRALTRLRAASIKEFDTIARLETQAIDEYNDAHHYRVENPLNYIHSNEPKVKEDKYTSFH